MNTTKYLFILISFFVCVIMSCRSYSKKIIRHNNFISNAIQNFALINNIEDPNKLFHKEFFGNPNVKFSEIIKTDEEIFIDKDINFLSKLKIGEILGPIKGPFNSCSIYKKVIGDTLRRSAKIRFLVKTYDENFPSIKKVSLDSLRKIIKLSENFPEIVRLYSQDMATSKNYGDMGWGYEGVIIKELEMKSKESQLYEIFEVETYFGIVFARVEEPWKLRKLNTFIRADFDDCD